MPRQVARMIGVQFVCILVGLLYATRHGDGCSCMVAHPQDQFCRSAFVIKASIIDRELIYAPTEKPKTESPPTEPMTEAPTYNWEEPSLLPDWPLPLQEVNVEEEFIQDNLAEIEIIPRQLERQLAPLPILADAPVDLRYFPDNKNTRRRVIKLEYTVKVEKIYKGDDILVERTLAKLATAPEESLCGLPYLDMQKSYIISGSFYNNELRINLCNLVAPYKSLTRMQRRGIKMMYKQSCERCTIASCYGRYCNMAPKENNICMFDTSQFNDSCQSQHSACTYSKTACKWQRNRDYKQCMIKQQTKDDAAQMP